MIKSAYWIFIGTLIGICNSAVQYGNIHMNSGESFDVTGFEQVIGDSIYLNVVDYRWQAGTRIDLNTGDEFELDQPPGGSMPKQIIALYIDDIYRLEIVKYKLMLKQSFNMMGAVFGGVIGFGISTLFGNTNVEENQDNDITSIMSAGFGAAAGYFLLGNFTKKYWRIVIVDELLTDHTLKEKSDLIKNTLGGFDLHLK